MILNLTFKWNSNPYKSRYVVNREKTIKRENKKSNSSDKLVFRNMVCTIYLSEKPDGFKRLPPKLDNDCKSFIIKYNQQHITEMFELFDKDWDSYNLAKKLIKEDLLATRKL